MEEIISAKLAAIAANAKTLSLDYTNGRLWEGDLTRRMKLIYSDLKDIEGLKGQGEKNYD